MNVYFAGSTRGKSKDQQNYLKIMSVLKGLKAQVVESWLVEELTDVEPNLTSQESLLKNVQLLHESDIAIFEISTPSFGVGYFIGQAIANYKKVLCLYPSDVNKEDLSEIIGGSTSSLLTVKEYTEDTVEVTIRDYIANFKLDDLRKFNFIATEEILKFITEGALKESKSKSEYLRDKIKQQIMK